MPCPAPAVGGVQVAVGETFRRQHISHDDDGGAGDPGPGHLIGDVRERAAQHDLLRPGGESHHRGGRFGAVATGEQVGDDGVDLGGSQVQYQRPTHAGQGAQILPGGIAVDSVATRLRVTVCATPGTVSSRPRTAAAAANAGTPGTIS